jgi:CBS domain-containing protein
MSAAPATVRVDTEVVAVARLMIEHNLRAVPVVDESGIMVGLVTEFDLMVRNSHLHFPAYLGVMDTVFKVGGDRNLEEELKRMVATTAEQVMDRDFRTAAPDDDLGELAHDMIHKRIPVVPVIDDGRIVGMLAPPDLVRLVARDASS